MILVKPVQPESQIKDFFLLCLRAEGLCGTVHLLETILGKSKLRNA